VIKRKEAFPLNMSIDETHYKTLWETVNTATPATVRDTSQQYFSADNVRRIGAGRGTQMFAQV
jgi:hypothetical protein